MGLSWAVHGTGRGRIEKEACVKKHQVKLACHIGPVCPQHETTGGVKWWTEPLLGVEPSSLVEWINQDSIIIPLL